MVDIRPQDLNPAVTPIDADSPIIIDQGLSGVNRTTSTEMVNAVAPVASQAEAEVGVDDVKRMTALKTKQSIASEVGVTVASYAAGQAGLSAVQSVNGKSGNSVTITAEDVGAVPDTFIDDIDANTLARHTHSNKAILDATTASFLTAEKTKLAGIAAGAQVNTVTSVAGKTGAVTLAKSDVGLGSVDNTADINKPISTATQGALDGKYNNPTGTTSQYIRGDGSLSAFPAIPQGTVTSVGVTVPTGLSASGSPVTSSGTIAVSYATGYQGYTSAEASKLAGIAAGAQVNTVNSVNTKTGSVVLNAADVGAAPSSIVTDVNANTADRHTHSNKPILDATTASFLAAEKTKLSGIEAGAQVNTVTSVAGKTGAVTLVKGDVGLGSVDNTSDASKPISTATQTALNAKANSSVTVSAGTGLTGGGNLTANRSVALNAASIASLGKADTALQAPGGTTGQILAKNSNTTNDVGWVSSEAATAVSYGPQTLTEAQQGQARANIGAGVLSGFRNKIINGDFDIWQRGEGPHTNFGYTADRWACYRSSGSEAVSVDRQLFVLGHVEVPGSPAGHIRANVTNGGPATNGYVGVAQQIEEVRTLAGAKATLTFYARVSTPREVAIELSQIFGSGGSPRLNVLVGKVQLTTTWEKYSYVIDVPSLTGKTVGSNAFVSLSFVLSAGTDFSSRFDNLGIQTGTFDFSRVSLVEGDATAEDDPFSPRHIQQELALCQRYYETGYAQFSGFNNYGCGISSIFKVEKRVAPTMQISNLYEQGVTNGGASGITPYSYRIGANWPGNDTGAYGAVTFDWAADAEL